MDTTQIFTTQQTERRNYADFLLSSWERLNWRHAGFGAMQAYILEGEYRELRVHVWHPSLVKAGMDRSGLCHDHRFTMRSTVLVGMIEQTDFMIASDPHGEWETWSVLHARAAHAKGGSFHQDPTPTGEFWRRTPRGYLIRAGFGYTFDKFAFHETRAKGLTITLVEKTEQEQVNARILAPRGIPIVHAFSDTLDPRHGIVLSVINGARVALEQI